MGKKGSWFSAIKRALLPHPKEKGSEKLSVKEKKKWGIRKLKHGDGSSFIPLHRKPSSIEKILGDAEREKKKMHPVSSHQQQKVQPSMHGMSFNQQQKVQPSIPLMHPTSSHQQQKLLSSMLPMASRVAVNHHKEVQRKGPPNNFNTSAIKIQAAFRGYMARRSYRALKGLVRLQRVMQGQSVRRQTINAMKFMQLLVRIQTQIQSRRIQMLEIHKQNFDKSDKEVESILGKWTQPSEIGHQEEWDDSLLTKEEIEARLQRKVEAVIKRERALAYAYSHQLWKATPKSAQTAFMEIRSGGYPWWWNWLERQLQGYHSERQAIHAKKELTPSNPIMELNPQPPSHTPASSKHEPALSSRAAYTNSSTLVKHAKPIRSTTAELPKDVPLMRDDESLTSCPPFSMPNYMAPTVSAKAKVRSQSTPKGRPLVSTPSQELKKRFSFPLNQSIGSLRWNKGSIFSSKDSSSQRITGKHKSMQSISNLSVDSSISLPIGIGRKSFE
ncbi:PREDICTED: protein IQ-DOMAIN 14 isoform X2 [Nelumbo nucifera]|uniref:Protein IQ-DOMAIN 14 isoform X2 n=1 Tax=Nelumbo nucifera TaxID=4432 RepID=A0A1U7ZXG4_NELNU|nr:PREDICTED: protein IQ-DOMAIN 14 isoform X2 [Nelumbo nucifera]